MEWALYLLIMHGASGYADEDQFGGIERLDTYKTKVECEELAKDLSQANGKIALQFVGGQPDTYLERQQNSHMAYTCAAVPKAYIYE